MTNILKNHTITNDEWDVIFPLLSQEDKVNTVSKVVGRPRYTNRQILQALLYWLADGLPTRRLKQYTGISYRTLAPKLDAWIEDGFFERLWLSALENQEQLCGLKLNLLFVDGRIGASPNGGENTGKSPVDRRKSGSKLSLLTAQTGTPLGVVIVGANRHDSPLFGPTLDASLVALPAGAQFELDRGYRGAPVQTAATERGFVAVIREAGVRTRSKRYPIECALSKFNRYRGIKIRVLRKASRWLALLQWAAAIITFRLTSKRLATST
jgi:transposase